MQALALPARPSPSSLLASLTCSATIAGGGAESPAVEAGVEAEAEAPVVKGGCDRDWSTKVLQPRPSERVPRLRRGRHCDRPDGTVARVPPSPICRITHGERTSAVSHLERGRVCMECIIGEE